MSIDTERWAEDHWDYVEQAGAMEDYEDEDQRLGGNDNPNEED